MFTADIPLLFAKHSASGHLFADDVQAFVHGPPVNQLVLSQFIESLSSDLHCWMSSNRLSLNSAKTQLIWFGTRQQLLKLDFTILAQRFPLFTFSNAVRDLGVTLDSTLSFAAHISNLSRSSFYHLRRLRAIRRSVSSSIFTTMVHAFVCTRIDYCNSLLAGLPKCRLSPLQSVLNAAARLIARLPRFSHISTFMTEHLHWLPLIARIRFKILFLTSRVLLGLAPRYLCDSIRRPLSAASGRSLRSLDRHDLLVPRSRTATAQHRAYASVGPMLWNDLPSTIRSVILTGGISASSRCLKTFLFSQSSSHWERF